MPAKQTKFRGLPYLTRLLIVTALLLAGAVGCAKPATPDTIFYGGDIVTMAAAEPANDQSSVPAAAPEAILVQDGRIARIGTRAEILALQTNDTVLVDLAGRTLAPGFIAVHTHLDLAAFFHGFTDLSGFANDTPDDVWRTFQAAVEAAPPGEWILCKGFDPMLVPGLRAPSIQQLDELAPENPVFIIAQNLHGAWANSAAFAELKITGETEDPAPGSYYETDDDGNLTGYIAEIAAIRPFTTNALQVIDVREGAVAALREYARNGISTIATLGLFAKDSKPFLLLEHLSTDSPGISNHLLEFTGILPEREATVRHFVYLQPDSDFLLPESTENGDDFFRIVGVKLWYDGSPYVASMLLDQPYQSSPLMQQGLGVPAGTSGEAKYGPEKFYALAQQYHTQGWQLAVHSQGDRATREVLNAFDRLLREYPRDDHRHRLEHGLLTPGSSLEQMRALGMSPSFHINHLYYYGEALRDSIIGARRAEIMLPVESVRKSGSPYSLHADLPMYPEVPLSLLATAVNRKTRNGAIIGADEALNVRAGLAALTTHPAYQLHMDTKIGSIETGKYADLVILDQNPLTVAPEKLRDVAVQATYVHGRRIWAQHQAGEE
ncbi:MAG: amidohydrolase [bacterium]|nr:amidohydrolase [bacterium]